LPGGGAEGHAGSAQAAEGKCAAVGRGNQGPGVAGVGRAQDSHAEIGVTGVVSFSPAPPAETFDLFLFMTMKKMSALARA